MLPCAYFEKAKKKMILRDIHLRELIRLFGPDPKNVSGKKITLWVEKNVRTPQGRADCVRIKAAGSTGAAGGHRDEGANYQPEPLPPAEMPAASPAPAPAPAPPPDAEAIGRLVNEIVDRLEVDEGFAQEQIIDKIATDNGLERFMEDGQQFASLEELVEAHIDEVEAFEGERGSDG